MAKFLSRFKERISNLHDSEPVEPGLTLNSDNKSDSLKQRSRVSPSGSHSPRSGNPLALPHRASTYLQKSRQMLTELIAKIPGSDKPLYRRYSVLLSLGVGGGMIALGWGWLSLERSLPKTAELFTFVRDETLTIKAGDGTILQQQGPATRENLKLKEIPKPLIQAFIASEDRRFYQHDGVDHQGIIRALFTNIRSADVVEGGSTITQQLARILFLNQERTVWRKLKEVRLSQKIEQKLSKEQILERYLNIVYLGSGAYGVADAAWVYFSKPVNKLTLPEMATIAGLAPAPSLYSPAVNLEAAQQRRNLVLQRMQQDKVITEQAAVAASNAPLTLNSSLPKRLQVKAPYFTNYIQQELPKYVSEEVLEVGGLSVETTLNPQWQKVGEQVVKNTVERNGRWQHFEQAALVSIDPRNGEIRAMVGGKDFGKNQFNRVTQAQRQPGSTFKGFVYATAIASGISPYKSYLDAPYIIEGYEPKNYSRDYQGWMSIRDATASSVNVIAVKVLKDVGFAPTIKLAQQMGIKSPLKSGYSLALGSSEVNLLELTSAYGTLATQGMYTEVHGIRRILNGRGEVLYAIENKPKQVLDRDSAAIMTWMLRNVVQAGTGRAAQLNRPVAGKTGTSDNSRDLWFIGYIPQLVTGVWLGNDDNDPTWGSSSTAALTWHQFMVKAVEKMPEQEFPNLPKLAGRKGSIKAQPTKPKRVISRRAFRAASRRYSNRAATEERYDNNRPSTRRNSRRYQRQQQVQTPTRTRRCLNNSCTQRSRQYRIKRRSPVTQPSSPQPSLRERLRRYKTATPSRTSSGQNTSVQQRNVPAAPPPATQYKPTAPQPAAEPAAPPTQP